MRLQKPRRASGADALVVGRRRCRRGCQNAGARRRDGTRAGGIRPRYVRDGVQDREAAGARAFRVSRGATSARGGPSAQNPASSVVAVGGSDAGIPRSRRALPRVPPDHPPTPPAPFTPRPQRRKRYSEAGVLFTDAYLARVEALPDGPRAAAAGAGASATADDSPAPAHPADAFKRAMRRFTTLGSTYAEMESLQELIDILVELAGGARAGTRAADAAGAAKSAKKMVEVASAPPETETETDDATRTPSPEFAPAARVFLGMLFLANSRPIHRHLITSARRFPPAAREAAERALDEEIASALAAAAADDEASGAGRMRPLAALASVNGCQPQTGMEQRVLRRAAVPAAALVARGAWGSREVEASDGFEIFGFGFHVSFFIFARTAWKEDGTRLRK